MKKQLKIKITDVIKSILKYKKARNMWSFSNQNIKTTNNICSLRWI